MDNFPIPAPAFDGKSRSVDAGEVFDWFRQGWAMFMAQPGRWAAASLLLLVATLVLLAVWIVGSLLLYLLTPVATAGFLAACRRADEAGTVAAEDFTAGFRHNTGQLIVLGALLLAAMLAIKALAFLLFGSSITGGLMMMPNPVGLGVLLGGSLLAMLLSSLLLVPLSMALWFAPALVFFNNMPATLALRASFDACLKNILPFLVYGLLLMVLGFFALLPAGLGLLVLIPVVSGSVYASYRSIFVAR